jgi:hypothetical protein
MGQDDQPQVLRPLRGRVPTDLPPKMPVTWPQVVNLALGVVALLAVLATIVLLVKLP